MNEKVVIGVDTGNRCIKTVNCSFVAGVKEHKMKPAIFDDVLEYKNKYYTLTSERLSYMEDKTESEDYFILTLFAIAKELKERQIDLAEKVSIHLGIGLPPSHIGRLQDTFVPYFKRSYVKFKYNSEEIVIGIDDVSLFPQGYAAIVPQIDKIINYPTSYIIDIGGYTTDVIMLKRGIPDMSFCESLPYGVIQLYNNIKNMAQTEYGRVPDETQIDYMIETGEDMYMDMSARVNEEASNYVDNLMRKLFELGVDLVLSNSIFVGGGSLRLKEYIKKSPYIKKKIFAPNINANAYGYEYIINTTNL